jgi:hypothetical protein
MKCFTALLAVASVLAFASTATLDELPGCAVSLFFRVVVLQLLTAHKMDCVLQALATGKCSGGDLQCTCTDPDFLETTKACLTNTCSSTEIACMFIRAIICHVLSFEPLLMRSNPPKQLFQRSRKTCALSTPNPQRQLLLQTQLEAVIPTTAAGLPPPTRMTSRSRDQRKVLQLTPPETTPLPLELVPLPLELMPPPVLLEPAFLTLHILQIRRLPLFQAPALERSLLYFRLLVLDS